MSNGVKIVTIVGARPQFIKAAVVSRAFNAVGGVQEVLMHTGQHFDPNMSAVFFRELGIPSPRRNLGIGGGTHAQNTGRMMMAIEAALVEERPDWVLVYGDTDSTLAGALVAAKLQIRLAHVEAGLRSFNRRMPEEVNRILTDHLADLLFTPTEAATANLANEGVPDDKVDLVGDVMFDAALYFAARAESQSSILRRLGLEPNGYILATIHREENVDDPGRLADLLFGFERSDQHIVLPMHPRTAKRLAEFGLDLPRNVQVIEPLGYLDMAALEMNARLIATDSGGVQKEAYFHGVPCLTLRDETEWVELVEIGATTVIGAHPDSMSSALASSPTPAPMAHGLYGSGDAGEKIVRRLLTSL